MSVLLVNACFAKEVIPLEPLGVCCIAAMLRGHGIKVELVDPCFAGWGVEETLRNIRDRKYDILGLSTWGTSDPAIGELASFVDGVRASGFKGHISAGGPLATSDHSLVLTRCPGIDSVVIGEGEIAFLELVSRLNSGQEWQNIEGVAYRDPEGTVRLHKAPRMPADLDALPLVARDLLKENLRNYGSYVWVQMSSARGCDYGCAFCSERHLRQTCGARRYRTRSPRSIVDEMEGLYREYGVRRFHFMDDIMILPGAAGQQKASELAELLCNRGMDVEIQCMNRVESYTPQVFESLIRCGVREFYAGVESFVPADLRLYRKGITLQQIENLLSYAERAGIYTPIDSPLRLKIGYIALHPWSTLHSLRVAHSVASRLQYSPKLVTTKLKLYPHTELRARAQKEDLLAGDDGFRFLDPSVAAASMTFESLVKRHFRHRSRIRTLEKIVSAYDLRRDVLGDLPDVRRVVDAKLRSVFGEVLELIADCTDTGKLKQLCAKLIFDVDLWFDSYYRSGNTGERIDVIQDDFELTPDIAKVFDRVDVLPLGLAENLISKYGYPH